MAIKKYVGYILCVICLSSHVFSADDNSTPALSWVNEKIEQLSKSSKDKTDQGKKDTESIVAQLFDYDDLARASLDKTWNKLTKAEQKKFKDLFKQMVETAYFKKAGNYLEKHKIECTKSKGNGPDNADVYCKGETTDVAVDIVYKMRKRAGTWQVFDVMFDGASLVQGYRDQFVEFLKTKSFNDLLIALKKKTQ